MKTADRPLVRFIRDSMARDSMKPADLIRAMASKGFDASRQRVSKWLNDGQRIPPEAVQAIAQVFSADPVALGALQDGLQAPSGDFLSADAQALGKRWQALPADARALVDGLVQYLSALSNPRYREWEARQASLARSRSKTPA